LVGSPSRSKRPFIFFKKNNKMKSGGGGGVRYKVTVHEEVAAIEAARRFTTAASGGGGGKDWAVVDVNEDQREAIIASGYSYVRVVAGTASRPENRLVAFTWLKSVADLDRCRRESFT
jgi:hypothetical protein